MGIDPIFSETRSFLKKSAVYLGRKYWRTDKGDYYGPRRVKTLGPMWTIIDMCMKLGQYLSFDMEITQKWKNFQVSIVFIMFLLFSIVLNQYN